MNSIWADTIWLYLGDVLFVAFLIWGIAAIAMSGATHFARELKLNLSYNQLRNCALWSVAWLFAALVLFKFIILQGGPTFTHLTGTGNHGSVQFSTIGEAFAAVATIVGLIRWIRFAIRHLQIWRTEDHYDHP